MTIEAALLAIIAALLLVSIIDARSRHSELTRLLDDLATMLGELFDRKD